MFHLAESVVAPALSPWPFGIIGILALTAGLLLVIRPRRAGEVWWKASQWGTPWRVPRWPVGATIAAGCFFLLVAIAMFCAAWVLFHR
jgi:hypothetical protein